MPLNMNTIGTGNGGSSNGTSGINLMEGSASNNASFSFSGTSGAVFAYDDDFFYHNDTLNDVTDKYRKNRYYSPETIDHSNAGAHVGLLSNGIWVDNKPYFWIESNRNHTNKLTLNIRPDARLYKFNYNESKKYQSSFTKIHTFNDVIRNESLGRDSDMIIIDGDFSTYTDYDRYAFGHLSWSTTYQDKSPVVYIYKPSTDVLTKLFTIKDLVEDIIQANISTLGSVYIGIYNAYYADNQIFIVMDSCKKPSAWNAWIVSYNLNTGKFKLEVDNIDCMFSNKKPEHQLFTGLSVLIDTYLYSFESVEYHGDYDKQYHAPYLNKQKIVFNPGHTMTLTNLSSNLLETTTGEDEWCKRNFVMPITILSKQWENHYLIGMALVDKTITNNKVMNIDGVPTADSEYSSPLFLQKNLMDIYIGSDNSIIENKPIKTTDGNSGYTNYQSITFVQYGSFGGTYLSWVCCMSFHFDTSTNTFGLIVGSWDSSAVNVFRLDNFTKAHTIYENLVKQILVADFVEGDMIISSGDILSIESVTGTTTPDVGPISPSSHKYKIKQSGRYRVFIQSPSSDEYPSTIIVDQYLNILTVEMIYEREKATVTISPIKNMKLNDILVTSSKREQIFTDESFRNRLYIDVKGVL